MSGIETALVIASAISGGLVAHLLWRLHHALRARLAGLRRKRAPAPDPIPAAPPAGVATKPSRLLSGLARGTAPSAPDPALAAEIRAMRADIADLARAQLDLIEDMAQRDGRLLSELRAVVSVPDADLHAAIRRIERAVDRAGDPPITAAAVQAAARSADRGPQVIEADPEDMFPARPSARHGDSLVSMVTEARATARKA